MTEQEIEKMAEEYATSRGINGSGRGFVLSDFIAGANAMLPEMERLMKENEELKKWKNEHKSQLSDYIRISSVNRQKRNNL